MCHPQGRSIAEDARSALTRRPARRYAVNDLPPASVRHARRRSDARHGAVNSEVAALLGAPRRPADRASNYPHPFEESLFLPGQLRTLQRRVKDWRRLAARRLVFADPIGASQGATASPNPDADSNDLASDSAHRS